MAYENSYGGLELGCSRLTPVALSSVVNAYCCGLFSAKIKDAGSALVKHGKSEQGRNEGFEPWYAEHGFRKVNKSLGPGPSLVFDHCHGCLSTAEFYPVAPWSVLCGCRTAPGQYESPQTDEFGSVEKRVEWISIRLPVIATHT
jgi:hypothetical protein